MEKTDIIVSEQNRHFSRDNSNNTTSITNLTSSSNNRDAFDMDDLLTDAQTVFNHVTNTEMIKILKNAKGVAFVKFFNSGSGIGNFKGRGIVMKHHASDDEWGGPCAIDVCGVSMGNGVGVNETCSVFVINDESFFSCLLQNSCNNYDNMSRNEFCITPGNLANNNWSSSKVVSFSFSKGAFIDFPLEKVKVTINNNVNNHYYQNEINPEVIFSGNIKSFDNKYFEFSRRLIDTVNNANISSGQHSEQGKSRQRYHYDLNSPLYQYYAENNKMEYSYQQLKQLSVLPYLGDIRVQKYKLHNVKAWIISGKAYRQIKDFVRAKKFSVSRKNDDSKTVEITKYRPSENAPLYQYYNNEKAVVAYSALQLRTLPQLPYLYDIQHCHKYHFLTKINPMNLYNTYKDTNINPMNLYNTYKDTNINPMNLYNTYKDTKMNPMNLINDLKGKMQNKNVPSTKYVVSEMAPLYQYYVHHENSKEVVYNAETLSKLPKFPFLNDITSNKVRFRHYNLVNVVKKNFKVPKFLQRRPSQKVVSVSGFQFNENIPMWQYYTKKDNETTIINGVYDHERLALLPKLPFLNDIHSPKVKLASYNPVLFVKRLYKKFVGASNQ